MPCVDPEEELTQAIEALRQKAGIPAGAGGDKKKCRQVIAQKGLMLLVRAISHVLEAEEEEKAASEEAAKGTASNQSERSNEKDVVENKSRNASSNKRERITQRDVSRHESQVADPPKRTQPVNEGPSWLATIDEEKTPRATHETWRPPPEANNENKAAKTDEEKTRRATHGTLWPPPETNNANHEETWRAKHETWGQPPEANHANNGETRWATRETSWPAYKHGMEGSQSTMWNQTPWRYAPLEEHAPGLYFQEAASSSQSSVRPTGIEAATAQPYWHGWGRQNQKKRASGRHGLAGGNQNPIVLWYRRKAAAVRNGSIEEFLKDDPHPKYLHARQQAVNGGCVQKFDEECSSAKEWFER